MTITPQDIQNLHSAIATVKHFAPESCGSCGSTNASCDTDCMDAANAGATIATLQRVIDYFEMLRSAQPIRAKSFDEADCDKVLKHFPELSSRIAALISWDTDTKQRVDTSFSDLLKRHAPTVSQQPITPSEPAHSGDTQPWPVSERAIPVTTTPGVASGAPKSPVVWYAPGYRCDNVIVTKDGSYTVAPGENFIPEKPLVASLPATPADTPPRTANESFEYVGAASQGIPGVQCNEGSAATSSDDWSVASANSHVAKVLEVASSVQFPEGTSTPEGARLHRQAAMLAMQRNAVKGTQSAKASPAPADTSTLGSPVRTIHFRGDDWTGTVTLPHDAKVDIEAVSAQFCEEVNSRRSANAPSQVNPDVPVVLRPGDEGAPRFTAAYCEYCNHGRSFLIAVIYASLPDSIVCRECLVNRSAVIRQKGPIAAFEVVGHTEHDGSVAYYRCLRDAVASYIRKYYYNTVTLR